MIDAYEIGIQLMLQEDVSAGLAVINRGLADVDRAIAATSANLAGLVRSAENATKAVATSLNGRTTPMTNNGNEPAPTQEQADHAQREPGSPLASAPKPERMGATLETISAAPNVQSKSVAGSDNIKPIELASDSRGAAVSPSAPVKNDPTATVWSGPQQRSDSTKRSKVADFTPTRSAPATPQSGVALPLPVQQQSLAPGQQSNKSVKSPAVPVLLTSSIRRDHRPATAGYLEQAPLSSITGPTTRPERPSAPWSGVDHSTTQTSMTRLYEKATAPQSASHSQPEPVGGTVMLDGRLVGQWLSEHMGREASRPPAGTSFFDPRQSPAWNVSGAL